MNGRLILLCLKSMLRRWKRVLRTIVTVFIAFLFVAGMLLFQENMYQYQTAVAKKHFGDWFIMNPYYNAKKDKIVQLKSHDLVFSKKIFDESMKKEGTKRPK